MAGKLLLFACVFFIIVIVSCQRKADYIERVTDIKDFKKVLGSRLNVLVVFSNKDKLPNKYYNVLAEVSDLAHGIGTVLHVDCGKGAKLCKKRKVSPGSAVIIHHYKEGSFKKEYDRALSAKSMVRFLKDPEGDAPWDEDPTAVDVAHVVTPSGFSKLISKSSLPILVMFYAPWCGHCKRLKPEFAAAASEAKASATLAGVDCVDPELGVLQQTFNVTGFPTLLYFRKGKMLFNYGGGYTKDDILTWLQDPAPPKEPEKEPEWSEEESEVVHLTDASFGNFVKESPSVLVMFYAPWCGHCKAMKPDYTESAATLKEEGIDGVLAAVDATTNRNLAEEYEVKGFPTLLYFANGRMQYKVNRRTKDDLISFMKEPVEEAPPSPADDADGEWQSESSNIVHLDDSTFKSFVKKKKHVLVMFYAPWCGHCKNAKPHFMNAAATFANNAKVAFAGIDCTENEASCSEHGVRGYPTFIYVNYGKNARRYEGGREEADFIKFMNDPSGATAPPTPNQATNPFENVDGEDSVLQLQTETIDMIIEDSPSLLIMFYAPWCGHCKRMIPDYVSAAKQLNEQGHSSVLAAIDATMGDMGTKYDVKGFPAIRYYAKGVFKEEYTGGRSSTDFVNYMKAQDSDDHLKDQREDL